MSASGVIPDRLRAAARQRTVPPVPAGRPVVKGKFLYRDDHKLHLKGVAYGPFAPTGEFQDGFDPLTVEDDFAAMTAAGFNAVRLYSVPGRWMLDAAARHGLMVMAGIPWEQHVTFLDERDRTKGIERRVRAGVEACAGHPAVVCYAIGNEIPASIVRWHGRRRVERFIERLYRAAKQEDPSGLVTYVNYPTTEYLQLQVLDLLCFNVYLESQDRLSAYLARLQNLAGDLPLVMAEVGLDSRRHGEARQAESLDRQLRSSFEAGCAGAFVFSWTDEWHRGGHDIEDWDFGLTTRARRPKPALESVRRSLPGPPIPPNPTWPSVSVVVCTHNDASTLADCLDGLSELRYPDYEVIVVSDGSTDATAQIVQDRDVRFVATEHRGLATARNAGLAMARGEIVAFLDADARPDPDWLAYLAQRFEDGDWAGVGGPNVPWPGAGGVARAVAEAPGAPSHVLISDEEAEHIPGCNMAFRRQWLEQLGGFDPRFRTAGDDVDICWRLRERGGRLGFSPGAVVWHHRRDTVRSYLRQQRGYGEAEGMLERKWPQNYSPAGHPVWRGRLYGNGAAQFHGQRRWRIYHGTWGSGLFQSVYQPAGNTLAALPLMPEFYLVVAALLALTLAGLAWSPLLAAAPALVVAVGALLIDAGLGAVRSSLTRGSTSRWERLRAAGLVGLLYVLQPLARLQGRLRRGLTPLRRRGPAGLAWPSGRRTSRWSEHWAPPEGRLARIEESLTASGAVVHRGHPYARWDLEVVSGPLGVARLRMAVEEHGAGRQLIRMRSRAQPSPVALGVALTFAVLAALAITDREWLVGGLLGAIAVVLVIRIAQECAAAIAALQAAIEAGAPSGGQDRAPAP